MARERKSGAAGNVNCRGKKIGCLHMRLEPRSGQSGYRFFLKKAIENEVEEWT